MTGGQWSVESLTGTDGTTGDAADAVIVFCGNRGESNPISLSGKREKPFQAGMTDTFEVTLPGQ